MLIGVSRQMRGREISRYRTAAHAGVAAGQLHRHGKIRGFIDTVQGRGGWRFADSLMVQGA
jgi:hypothetical protein